MNPTNEKTKYYDIIGGSLDNSHHPINGWEQPPAYFQHEEKGETYMALRCKIKPDAEEEVTIYFLTGECGLTPQDAMNLWRERHFAEPSPEDYKVKTVKLAEELLATDHNGIVGNGPEAFCEMCEKMIGNLGEIPVFQGRSRLMMELTSKAAEVRRDPQKYAKRVEQGSAKPKQLPIPPRFLLYHPESDSYMEAYSERHKNELLESEPLLVDVTGDGSHEAARKRENNALTQTDTKPLTPAGIDPDDAPW